MSNNIRRNKHGNQLVEPRLIGNATHGGYGISDKAE